MRCGRWLEAILVAATVVCAGPAAADVVVPEESRGLDVVIRREARSDSAPVGLIPFDEMRTVLSSVPHWYQVQLESGGAGFVSKRSVRLIRLPPSRDPQELRVHYLNVGAGSCALVECPGANAPPMIVDCGSVGRAEFDLNGPQAASYLRAVLADHNRPPTVVISHPHTDHYSLIPTVLDGVQTQTIWLGGQLSGYSGLDFPQWLAAQRNGNATVHGNRGRDFSNGGQPMSLNEIGCGLAEVFTLTVNSGNNPNANSHIMEIRYNDFGVTFTGDAQGITERQADVNYDGNVKTTVLTGSHHGAHTHSSNSDRWINATQPEVVVFSAGSKFSHPRCSVVTRYEPLLAAAPRHPTRCGNGRIYVPESSSRLAKYVTATNGVVVVTSNGASPLRVFCDATPGCNGEVLH